MIAIPNERLRERAREKVMGLELAVTQTAFADSHAELEEELELALIALASLEAEAVAWTDADELRDAKNGGNGYLFAIGGEANKFADPRRKMMLYTAPPAPVSVPTFEEWCARAEQKPVGWVRDAMKEAYDGCRDAMLQGAEPVTKECKLPDDFDFNRFNDLVWLEAVASNPHMHSPTTSTIAMVALELNRKLAAGKSPVIPDGWVACSELMPEQFKAILAFNEYGEVWSGAYDRYWNFYCDNLLVEHVTHWMPLPAAPQKEVK